MIYSNPLNESNIILRGEEADSFLESYGITLLSDAVAIGEMVMDSITGQNIMAENGIILNEDHIILEGKQAEEYLKRKMKEKEESEKDDGRHGITKYDNINDHTKSYYPGRRSQIKSRYSYSWGENRKPDIANFDSHVENNPKHKTAKDIEKHREIYSSVMPKNKTTSEKKLESDRNKEKKEIEYANKVASHRYEYELEGLPTKKGTHNFDNGPRGSKEYSIAADAARRHYRRTHKNESTIFKYADLISE